MLFSTEPMVRALFLIGRSLALRTKKVYAPIIPSPVNWVRIPRRSLLLSQVLRLLISTMGGNKSPLVDTHFENCQGAM